MMTKKYEITESGNKILSTMRGTILAKTEDLTREAEKMKELLELTESALRICEPDFSEEISQEFAELKTVAEGFRKDLAKNQKKLAKRYKDGEYPVDVTDEKGRKLANSAIERSGVDLKIGTVTDSDFKKALNNDSEMAKQKKSKTGLVTTSAGQTYRLSDEESEQLDKILNGDD